MIDLPFVYDKVSKYEITIKILQHKCLLISISAYYMSTCFDHNLGRLHTTKLHKNTNIKPEISFYD
jgi:hypothetical protein